MILVSFLKIIPCVLLWYFPSEKNNNIYNNSSKGDKDAEVEKDNRVNVLDDVDIDSDSTESFPPELS